MPLVQRVQNILMPKPRLPKWIKDIIKKLQQIQFSVEVFPLRFLAKTKILLNVPFLRAYNGGRDFDVRNWGRRHSASPALLGFFLNVFQEQHEMQVTQNENMG